MKKIIAAFLLLAMTIGLYACAKTPAPSSETAAAAPSETAAATPSESDQPIELTLSDGMIGDHILHGCSQKIKDEIEKRTNGAVTVHYYSGDTLGTAQERADMLMAGETDIDMSALSVYDSYNPQQGIMSAFFMFESWEHYLKCTQSDEYKAILSSLEKTIGATVLGEVYYAKRNFLSTKPIESFADVQGMKFRVPNEAMPIAGITAIGAVPTPLAGSEVYMALSNGTVDATENGADQIVNQAFYEVAPYMTMTAHQYQTMVYFMSDACRSKLTDEQFQIVCEVVQEACAEYNTLAQESEKKSEDLLREKITCFDIDLTEFYQAAETMYEQYDDVWGEGTWEAFKALAD